MPKRIEIRRTEPLLEGCTQRRLSIPTADEPRVTQFGAESIKAAVKYLDDGSTCWVREKKLRKLPLQHLHRDLPGAEGAGAV